MSSECHLALLLAAVALPYALNSSKPGGHAHASLAARRLALCVRHQRNPVAQQTAEILLQDCVCSDTREDQQVAVVMSPHERFSCQRPDNVAGNQFSTSTDTHVPNVSEELVPVFLIKTRGDM